MFEKFDVVDILEQLKKMDLGTIDKIQKILHENMEKILKGQQKRRENIENAIEAVKIDLVKDFNNRRLIIKQFNQKISLTWKDFIIGNSEGANLYTKGNMMGSTNEGNAFEITVTYQQGKYWLLNNRNMPLRSFYLKLQPESKDTVLRPEDIIKAGSIELKVCRFNVGRAEHQGTRSYMEDRSIIVHDLGVHSRLDVSLFAVFDGHGGSNCSQFLMTKMAQTIKQHLTMKDRNQIIDIEAQDHLFEFIKSAIEAVSIGIGNSRAVEQSTSTTS